MKKKIFSFVLCMLLVVSFGAGGVFLFGNFGAKEEKTFSLTSHVNELVKESMSLNEIANLYLDSCVSVYVQTGENSYSLGSGVCVAACGYTTSSGFVANRGAYFVTNYHVISRMVEKDFQSSNSTAYIILNNEDISNAHESILLWHDKDVDMALLYCDEDLTEVKGDFGWISTKDRWIACDEKDKLGFDEVFTIGTPLNMEYQNTLSLGYVSNQTSKDSFTTSKLYVYGTSGDYKFTTNEEILPPRQTIGYYDVLNNAYEDLIMINLDITNGNSGGAVFDKDGFVIGLATLGVDSSLANTASLNFAVPIHPLNLVLDNLIVYNENQEQEECSVIKISDLGILGLDRKEASYIVDLGQISETQSKSYYIDDTFIYSLYYPNAFKFDGEGYVILSTKENGKTSNIENEFVVTSITKGEEKTDIFDRNDLVYFLYSCKKGDEISLNGYYLGEKTQEICYLVEL